MDFFDGPHAVQTSQAPQAIGPYSQAMTFNGMVYCSGQIAIDPQTGELIDGDVAAQTERVIANLRAVLGKADSRLSRVLKTTVYLTSMADFEAVNAAYAAGFAGCSPARATIAVKELPKGALVEIDCIAAGMPRSP